MATKKNADLVISRKERDELIANPSVLKVIAEIEILQEASRLGDTESAKVSAQKIKNQSAAIHDALVFADKAEAVASIIKGLVAFAALSPFTLKDKDLLESGIDGVKCQAGAKRYVHNKSFGTWSSIIKDIHEQLGIEPEAIVDSCASFTLKGLAEFCGLTQDAFLERFGGFDMVRNAPSVKRTW